MFTVNLWRHTVLDHLCTTNVAYTVVKVVVCPSTTKWYMKNQKLTIQYAHNDWLI